MSLPDEINAPMPDGVVAMTKQQLWNWFHRATQAAAEQVRLREKFFTMTTGLHSSRSAMLGDHASIVEAQCRRIRGLEQQMAQMQKGYEKKLRKELASSSVRLKHGASLLQRVRVGCLAAGVNGAPRFEPAVERALFDEIQNFLAEQRIEALETAQHVAGSEAQTPLVNEPVNNSAFEGNNDA